MIDLFGRKEADTERFTLTYNDLFRILRVNRNYIHVQLRAGTFPRPIYPRGKHSTAYFDPGEVEQWLADKRMACPFETREEAVARLTDINERWVANYYSQPRHDAPDFPAWREWYYAIQAEGKQCWFKFFLNTYRFTFTQSLNMLFPEKLK